MKSNEAIKSKNDDTMDLPDLTLYLLSGIAKIENMSVVEILKNIEEKRQRDVDIVSAVLVFLTSYLNFYFKLERKNTSAFRNTQCN